MSDLREIESRIRADWPEANEPLRIVRALVEAADRAEYITLPLVLQWLNAADNQPVALDAGDDARLEEVFKWTTYLRQIGLVEQHYELVRDDDTTVLLENGFVDEALATGEMFDPDTGTPIDDWDAHVIVYYTPSRQLRSLLAS